MEVNGNALKCATLKLVGFALMLSITAVTQETQPTTAIAQEADRGGHPAPQIAVLYGFANVNDRALLSEGPLKETCSHSPFSSASTSATKTTSLTADEEFQVADNVTEELAKGLEQKMSVTFANPPEIPATGSLVITGCFVDMEPGSASKRVVGMGLGASHLSAHVRVFYVGASGSVPVDEFDMAVKGSQKVPPLGAVGLAFNAARERRETLEADAARLADEILKRLETDQVF